MFAALHPGNRLVLPEEHLAQFISGFNPFPAGEGEGGGPMQSRRNVHICMRVSKFLILPTIIPRVKGW